MLRRFIYISLLIGGLSQLIIAQNSQVLYYMNLPQNHLLNPALRPSNSFYFGIPAITGINVGINNNFVNFSDIFMPGQADSIITFLHPDYNIDDFIAKLKNINSLAAEVGIQLFGLGFNAGKDLYISIDVIERIEGNIVLPVDILKLGLKGNEDFLGKTIDLSSLNANFKYYREYGLGFSRNFGNKLRIGVKAKMLAGIASMKVDNRSLSLTVNDDFSHSLNADLGVSMSGPADAYFNTENQIDSIVFNKDAIESWAFYTNMTNLGFGLDLGAVYNISEKLTVSAAINDLGYIRWIDNVTNIEAKSEFKFSGFNINDVVTGDKTFDDLARELVDSLKNSFTFSDNNAAFNTSLPLGITVGASYNLTKSLSFGLLSHSIISSKHLRQAVTLSGNLNLGNALSTSLCYTASNGRYDNFGAGLAFRAGFFQIYMIADRIPVTWNKIISDGSSIVLPSNWNTATLRLGMNLSFGNRVSRKNDKPMLIEQNL